MIYLTSGSDYLSNFYGLPCERIFNSYLQNLKFVNRHEHIVTCEQGFPDGHIRVDLSSRAYTNLIACAYLDKFNKLYKHIRNNPSELIEQIETNLGNSVVLKELFSWLGYSDSEISEINEVSPEKYCVR